MTIQPIFYATSFSNGGLGMSPYLVGICLGTFGLANGIFQALFFSVAVMRYGERRVYMAGLSCFGVVYMLCPIMNQLSKQTRHLSFSICATLLLQFFLLGIANLNFGVCSHSRLAVVPKSDLWRAGAVMLFVVHAAPNPDVRGATNGMAHSIVCVVRVLGSTVGAALFSLSLERDFLWGYGFYVFMSVGTLAAVFLARMLPPRSHT